MAFSVQDKLKSKQIAAKYMPAPQEDTAEDRINKARQEAGLAPRTPDKPLSASEKWDAKMTERDAPTIEEPEKEEKSFWERSWDVIKERASGIGEAFTEIKEDKIHPLEGSVRTVGELAGGFGDLLYEGLRAGVKTILPEKAEEKLKEVGADILKTRAGQAGLEALEKGVEAYDSWASENPRIAKDLEAVVNIATLLPTTKGAQVGTKGAKAIAKGAKPLTRAAGEGLDIAGKSLIKKAEKTAVEDIVSIVGKTTRAMTKKEKTEALKAGLGKKKLLGGLDVKPSKFDYEIADAVKGVVKPGKHVTENIDNVHKAIGSRAKKLKGTIGKDNKAFELKNLKSKFTKARKKSDIIFGGDTKLKKNYNTVVNLMTKQLKKVGEPTLENLHVARQNFDKIINKKFPNLFDKMAGDNVRANAVKDIRTTVNNFIAKELPDNNPMKALLREQTLMYRSVDNMAANEVKKVGKGVYDRVSSTIRAHPLASTIGVGALSASAVTGLIASPVAIGTLLAYGSYRVGKKVVTSKELQKSLGKFLQKAGKTLNPNEREAIKELMEQLDKAGISWIRQAKNKAGLSTEDITKLPKDQLRKITIDGRTDIVTKEIARNWDQWAENKGKEAIIKTVSDRDMTRYGF